MTDLSASIERLSRQCDILKETAEMPQPLFCPETWEIRSLAPEVQARLSDLLAELMRELGEVTPPQQTGLGA